MIHRLLSVVFASAGFWVGWTLMIHRLLSVVFASAGFWGRLVFNDPPTAVGGICVVADAPCVAWTLTNHRLSSGAFRSREQKIARHLRGDGGRFI